METCYKRKKVIKKTSPISLLTPCNQLEAGILFGLKLPVLIFREADVFDSTRCAPANTDAGVRLIDGACASILVFSWNSFLKQTFYKGESNGDSR